ncbi:hypothetical protein [Burkholderia alba]|uniref:hypothetical protein n=1 Tax=Burkholderia alba TaxID=2683677 RepID=UPI002B059BAB|nr:hypothetical protein [Burkholderia alba]
MVTYSSTSAAIPLPRSAPLSWGAIAAGCFASFIVGLLLSLIGTALGASTVDPWRPGNPLADSGTGIGLWLGATALLSVAAGAFVAGFTAPRFGALHGMLAWSVTAAASVWLFASAATGVAGMGLNAIGGGLSLAGRGVAAAAPGLASGVQAQLGKAGVSLDWDTLQQQLDQLLRDTGTRDLQPSALRAEGRQLASGAAAAASDAAAAPQQADTALSGWFAQVRAKSSATLDAADKDALANLVAARTGRSHDEAVKLVDQYAQTYQQALAKYQAVRGQAEQVARAAADRAAAGIAKAAWASVALLVLGTLFAALGGTLGRRAGLRTPLDA